MHWLGHDAGDIGHFVDPAAPFFRAWAHAPQCGSKARCTVTKGQIGRNG